MLPTTVSSCNATAALVRVRNGAYAICRHAKYLKNIVGINIKERRLLSKPRCNCSRILTSAAGVLLRLR